MYHTSSHTPVYGKMTKNGHGEVDTETQRHRDRDRGRAHTGSKDITVPLSLSSLTILARIPPSSVRCTPKLLRISNQPNTKSTNCFENLKPTR